MITSTSDIDFFIETIRQKTICERMSQSEYGQGAQRVSEGCGFWVPHGYGGHQAHILGRGLKEKAIALYHKVAKLGDHAGQWNLRIFYLQVERSNHHLRA
ncbi:F-box protein [Pyrus ussuriensis x Pyrus communis]|uniref:F-box protein n=1 Tax=Pyrus ussuriensis x Pyrus communis TaxID=2448454 RepID=A0A5N5I4Y3_9ROSA|nr:F-box protein [Pyrus ussuriensis x Pyrus communis]